MANREIEGFHPKMLELIMAATTRRVEVPFTTKALATSCRHRLYHLRQKILKTDRPDKTLVQRTKFYVEQEGPIWKLIAEPADSDVAPAIEAALAGVIIPELEAPALPGAIITPTITTKKDDPVS